MKKVIAVVAVLALALCSMFMVACGGGVEGKYSFYSIEMDGKEYKVGDTFMEMELTQEFINEEMPDFELKKDGALTFGKQEGTWKKDGDKYILTMDGEDAEVTINGNTLVMEEHGMKITYKK